MMQPRSHSHPRRPAFTLVEILVVIGVIVVLVGIAVVGFIQIDRAVTGKSSKVTLQNAQGLVDEFAAVNGTGLLEGTAPALPTLPAPVYTDTSTTVFAQAPTPGDVTTSGTDRFGTVVSMTELVMERLQRIPHNHDAMLGMPSKQLLAGASTTWVPMLTDGWRNPIIFVPAGGLTGVIVNYGQATQQTRTITSPDHRPFWASAGPDGDFSKGDDNVYSFQN